MPQEKPQWEELPEFIQLAEKITAKYDELEAIEISKIIAYVCTNKSKPESKAKLYELTAEKEPVSFTNTKSYFVTIFQEDWDARGPAERALIVLSVLLRIDPTEPGKILPLDYKDQSVMVNTFGANWMENGSLPNILEKRVELNIPEPAVAEGS